MLDPNSRSHRDNEHDTQFAGKVSHLYNQVMRVTVAILMLTRKKVASKSNIEKQPHRYEHS